LNAGVGLLRFLFKISLLLETLIAVYVYCHNVSIEGEKIHSTCVKCNFICYLLYITVSYEFDVASSQLCTGKEMNLFT